MTGENLKHACIALVNHKITAAHAMILLMAEAAPASMTEIAEAGGFTTSNATGLVDSMCSQNLVSREQLADDRRKVMVVLAPEGKDLLKSIKKQIEHV